MGFQIDYLELFRQFISNLQFIQQFGLLGIFFVHMIPSIFFVAEGVIIAAVISGIPPITIVFFAILGGTVGDFLWYALGYYSYRKIKKIENMKFQRVISRYKKAAFLYSAFPGGEILMVYAGIKHFHIMDILPFVIISNLIRAGLAVGIVTGIITFLPEIIKQIIF